MPYGFSTQLDPSAKRQQAVKQRQNPPSINSSKNSQTYYKAPVLRAVEPPVLPVENFKDSKKSSDTSSSRSNEGSSSVRSRKSNGSRSSMKEHDTSRSASSPSPITSPELQNSFTHERNGSQRSYSSKSSAADDNSPGNESFGPDDIHL